MSGVNGAERLRDRARELLARKPSDETPEQRAERLVEEALLLHTELAIQRDELVESHRRLEALHVHYQRLFEAAPVGFIRISSKHVIEDINEAGRTLLGLEVTWNRLHTVPFTAFLPAAAMGTWNELTRADGGLARTTLVAKHGAVVVDLRTVPWAAEDGGWLVVIEDVTEIAGAHARQQEAEERLGRVVRQMSDGLVVIDVATGLIEEHNEAFSAMLGWAGHSLVGMAHESFFVERLRGVQLAALRHTSTDGGPIRIRYAHVDGEERTTEVTAGVAHSGGKEVEYLLVRDVTARLRAEERQRMVEAKLSEVQKLEALGLLAAGVAHDMNNLLTAVLAATELPPTEESLADLRAAALRGRELTERLLAVSRRKPLRSEPFDVLAVVEEVVTLARRTFRRDITVELARPDGRWLVTGDSGQWHQALLNLLINARDAITRSGHIRVIAEERDGSRFLRVQDDGMGMTADVMRRAFEPFFTTKSDEKGTGLGLAHVRAVVAAHGGTTSLESRPGAGTTVTLGILTEADAPVAAPPDAQRAATAQEPTVRKVLVVDDEPFVRRATARLLERLGWRPTTVESVTQAMATLENETFDLVLTDQSMPTYTGDQLCRAVRCRWPNTPVVVMTGLADDRDVETLKAIGVNAVLGKPFRSEELQRMLDHLEPSPPCERREFCDLPVSLCPKRAECTLVDGPVILPQPEG
jgi:PAS domain S-box-containing protein